MKMEALIGVRLLQIRKSWGSHKLGRARKDPPLEVWRERGPTSTLILDF